MHNLYRILWAARAVIYKLVFGRFGWLSYIGPPTFLLRPGRIHIGKRVRIFPGLRAECHGKGALFIADNVSIGQNFHVIAGSKLLIGSGCLISGDVFVTDTDHTFDLIDVPVFDQPDRTSSTKIGDNCFIGIGARIQAGTNLGCGCVVGANSVVRGDFPDYSMIVGAPARVVKRYSPEDGTWQRLVSNHSNEINS
ncbi:TPA: acyltransferase [Stenotrophomonas maltophilia]|nr:acyltransferase [Stenotrophomonas maltophilia]